MNKNDELLFFKKTGFFKEKDAALSHLQDADEILISEGVDYCLMFGTLLGLLRHGDFIPGTMIWILLFLILKNSKKNVYKNLQKKAMWFCKISA